MNFNKKTLTGVSSVLVFALVLGLTAVSFDNSNKNMVHKDIYGIQSSAGAYAAIGNGGNTITAGVNGAVDQSVGVVNVENAVVGQGVKYETFGYTNLGIAIVNGNLNVRKEASTSSKVVGKMTNYAACEILGEENGFYKIKSGNAEGYVSVDYIVIGEEALAIAQTEAKEMATVTTQVLNLRADASTESKVISSVNKGEEIPVVEVLDGWVKVAVDNVEGYVSADYVDVAVKLKTAQTIKELYYGEGVSDTRVDLVNYALQFVGNPYVWAGTSLTKGIDCSGFTMRIYETVGIKLPHHSGSQPAHGKKISRSEIKPGDLIFYASSGRIDHVAMYIGNGQIVHASSPRTGIIISNAFYTTPVCIVSYLP